MRVNTSRRDKHIVYVGIFKNYIITHFRDDTYTIGTNQISFFGFLINLILSVI